MSKKIEDNLILILQKTLSNSLNEKIAQQKQLNYEIQELQVQLNALTNLEPIVNAQNGKDNDEKVIKK